MDNESSADKSIQFSLLDKAWEYEESSIVVAISLKEAEKNPMGTPTENRKTFSKDCATYVLCNTKKTYTSN